MKTALALLLTELVLHGADQVLLGVVRGVGRLDFVDIPAALAIATDDSLPLVLLILLHLLYLLLHHVVRLDVTGAVVLPIRHVYIVRGMLAACNDNIKLLLVVASFIYV